MKRVLIAADVDPLLVQLLRGDERFSVEFEPMTTEEQLIARVAGFEILVTRFHNRVSAAVLAAATDLRLIAQGTSGIDNIDARAAAERGIAIVSTPGENANSVAELVIAAMISLSRTVPSYDREVKSGIWRRADCAVRREIRGQTLGILGLGRVGSRVAELAHAFGMKTIACDPYVEDGRFQALSTTRAQSIDLLSRDSDFLTLHVPATEETAGLAGRSVLHSMRQGAILINMSRGSVLDTSAAVELLESGHLGGLALDVFADEPPADHWPDHPQLLLTPHIAGCTREAKASIAGALYEAIVRIEEGSAR